MILCNWYDVTKVFLLNFEQTWSIDVYQVYDMRPGVPKRLQHVKPIGRTHRWRFCCLTKILKNVICEYDRWVVATQLCKLRDTSNTLIARVWPSSSWSVPPVEAQVISVALPWHRCRFSFPFFLFFFLCFSSPFCRPLVFLFFLRFVVLSFFGLFLLSPSSLFFYRVCSFRFPAFLGGGLC